MTEAAASTTTNMRLAISSDDLGEPCDKIFVNVLPSYTPVQTYTGRLRLLGPYWAGGGLVL